MSTSASCTHDPALAHYEHLARLSGDMLRLAQRQDWPGLIALSQQYIDAVEALRRLPSQHRINTLARQALLTKILDDDALLRELAMPELARLGKLMGSLTRQRALHRAYGPHQAA